MKIVPFMGGLYAKFLSKLKGVPFSISGWIWPLGRQLWRSIKGDFNSGTSSLA